MTRVVLCDSGFWMGLFDKNDGNKDRSIEILECLKKGNYTIGVPWPVFYEFLNSTFFRNNQKQVDLFEQIMKGSKLEKFCDVKYRDDAFESVFSNHKKTFDSSLVDSVIKNMVEDRNLQFCALVTYNYRDFHKNCIDRKIEIITNKSGPLKL